MAFTKFSSLFFLLAYSGFIYGSECSGMKEGEVYRLDQENRSLSNVRVQDQDGFGSCYANTASLLLQSTMKGSPNLSYLNLALFYAEGSRPQEELDNFIEVTAGKTPEETSRSNLFDSGYTCETIKLAKKYQKESGIGALCRVEDVKLEHNFFKANTNSYSDKNFYQEDIVSNTALYLSEYQRAFGNAKTPEEKLAKKIQADQYNLALTKLIENNIDHYLAAECKKPKMDSITSALSNMILDSFNRNKDCLNNNDKINLQLPKCLVYNLLGEVKVSNSEINFDFRPDVLKYLESQESTLFKAHQSENDFYNNMEAIVEAKINDKEIKKDFQNLFKEMKQNIHPDDKSAIEEEYQRIIKGKLANCIKDDFLKFFWDEKGLEALAKQNATTCHYEGLLSSIPDLSWALYEGDFLKNTKDVLNVLTTQTPLLGYRSSMMNLIAKDCQANKRLRIPDNLECTDYPNPITQKTFANPRKLQRETLLVREKMMASLKKNQALGITICTKFWNEPNYKWLMKESEKTMYKACEGLHGMHAVAVVGYRCKNNKVQYLGQNSWGAHWKLKNNHFEIENGKIWMDEDELMANMTTLNFMEGN